MRAEHAAITGKGFQKISTARAFVEVDARIYGHFLGRAVTALRARKRRLKLDHGAQEI